MVKYAAQASSRAASVGSPISGERIVAAARAQVSAAKVVRSPPKTARHADARRASPKLAP